MPALDPITTHICAQIGPAMARVAAIAARQHGVISHEQLVAVGVHRSTIPRWVRAGHLHRIHRGVYAVGHPNISRDGRYLAAVLAGGEGAVLSHTPAARHLGLDRARAAGTIHLTLPRDNKRSPGGILVHRPRLLEPQDVARRFGVPTTTATRTLYDLTPSLSANALRNHFERAEYLDLLDRARLNQLLVGSTGHRGITNLRSLAGYSPLPLSRIRSLLEGIIVSLCRTYSLPMPAVNVPLLGYEVDFLWPAARFVVEADGADHLDPAQRDRDNARDIALARAGYLIRRYSSRAMNDEDAVAAEVLAILIERGSP